MPEHVKAFVVQRLAMYDTPTAVAAAVADEFGLQVTRSHVYAYDATRAGAKPAKKWCALFETTRTRFLDTLSDEPMAQKAVRIRTLARLARKAEDAGDLEAAAGMVERAAKEMGNAYTNRREMTGADGAPLVPPGGDLTNLSAADLATLAAALASPPSKP